MDINHAHEYEYEYEYYRDISSYRNLLCTYTTWKHQTYMHIYTHIFWIERRLLQVAYKAIAIAWYGHPRASIYIYFGLLFFCNFINAYIFIVLRECQVWIHIFEIQLQNETKEYKTKQKSKREIFRWNNFKWELFNIAIKGYTYTH